MRKTTPKYQATVHTLEIQPYMNPEWEGHQYSWWSKIYHKGLGYIDREWVASDGNPRMIINPHKLHHGESGKWLFEYRPLSEIAEDMEQISQETEISGYALKRLDICLDADQSYKATEKLTRLIVLMLSLEAKADNRYWSIDPLTLETKTVKAMNGKHYRNTLEVEHYNRELLSQNEWENPPIVNRLELRAMRQQITWDDSMVDVVNRWVWKLEELTEAHMKQALDQVTEAVYHRWERYRGNFKRRKPTPGMCNSFYSCQADEIYTRDQLVKLYAYDRLEAKAVDNLLQGKSYGDVFDLYTFEDAEAEVGSLLRALNQFLSN